MFDSNKQIRDLSVKKVDSSEFIHLLPRVSANFSFLAGSPDDFPIPPFQIDRKDHEEFFRISNNRQEMIGSLKRSHLSWDLWSIGFLTKSANFVHEPQAIGTLIDHMVQHVLSHASKSLSLLSLTTDTPGIFTSLGFTECFRFGEQGKDVFMIRPLNVPIRVNSSSNESSSHNRAHHSPTTSVIIGLSSEQIIKAASLAGEAWGKEVEAVFCEENLRFKSQGASIFGSFDGNESIIGSGTIMKCYGASDLWGLAWGVVSEAQRSKGIGSELTQARLEYAREQSPSGVAIIITSDPRHALKNGFREVVRYGSSLEKSLLAIDL